MVNFDDILRKLPYEAPFLFVDELTEVNAEGIIGCYTLRPDSSFFKGHFKDHPVTPGVILTEIMAQIGVVCLGIFLTAEDGATPAGVALTSCHVEFLKPVYPGETVRAVSKKIYFRFGKLKCAVALYNERHEVVCEGQIAGIIQKNDTHA